MLEVFCKMVENQFGKKVKIFHLDNGKEFIEKFLNPFHENEGLLMSPLVFVPHGRMEWLSEKIVACWRLPVHFFSSATFLKNMVERLLSLQLALLIGCHPESLDTRHPFPSCLSRSVCPLFESVWLFVIYPLSSTWPYQA